MVRQCRQELRTCDVPIRTDNGDVWSDGHEDLDWLVSRRTCQWRRSPSHWVCYTWKPGPRINKGELSTLDPVFRVVAYTGNARDLWLAESSASENASAGTVMLRFRKKNASSVITTNAGRVWKKRARTRDMPICHWEMDLSWWSRKLRGPFVHPTMLTGEFKCSEGGNAGCWPTGRQSKSVFILIRIFQTKMHQYRKSSKRFFL